MTVVRRAALHDIEQLAILFDAYRQWYQQTSDVKKAKQFLTDRITNNESVIFMAYDEGKAVGFTQLYPIFTSVGMQRTWLLNDLFVDASARGKGIATQLLNAAKEHGRTTGSKWLMLQTGEDNFDAQALYEKNGWKRITDIFYELPLK